MLYVGFGMFIIALSLIVTVSTGEAYQIFTNDDWLIFIIACGSLAICESIDKKE